MVERDKLKTVVSLTTSSLNKIREKAKMKNAKATSNNTSGLVTFIFFVAMIVTMSSASALAQGTDYWTTTGSASTTEDESNPARPTYTNQTAAINGGATGAYVLRYNLTAVDGLFNSANSFMRLRVRDNGAGASVQVMLRRSNLSAGGIETIATFDSETIGAGSGFQTPADVLFTHTFDFTGYVYWLDVTLQRSDASGLPGFGGAIIGTL